MARLMSVTLTEQAVVERRKTVTRRLGWWKTRKGARILQPGDRLTLCRKVMGRKAGDPLVRLAEVEIVSVRRELLCDITHADIAAEGVDPAVIVAAGGNLNPHTGQPTRASWITWFCAEMGVTPNTGITRIEWRYLDGEATDG